MRWWQRVLLASTLLIAFLALVLLPKHVFALIIFSGTALNLLLGFVGAYVDRKKGPS